MSYGYQAGGYRLPGEYRIRVQGRIEEGQSPRYGGMAVCCETAPDDSVVSTLTGVLPDQGALAAILGTLYDFGYALLSVEYLPAAESGDRS